MLPSIAKESFPLPPFQLKRRAWECVSLSLHISPLLFFFWSFLKEDIYADEFKTTGVEGRHNRRARSSISSQIFYKNFSDPGIVCLLASTCVKHKRGYLLLTSLMDSREYACLMIGHLCHFIGINCINIINCRWDGMHDQWMDNERPIIRLPRKWHVMPFTWQSNDSSYFRMWC